MSGATPAQRKLAERILTLGGQVPLALLLEVAVPVAQLRELARRHGLSPKGGFRIERAPAHVLAPLLAEQKDAARLDEVLATLLPSPEPKVAPADAAAAAAAADALALLPLREAELQRLRDEVERLREAALRTREREADLARRLELAERDATVLRASVQRLERPPVAGEPARTDRDLERRVRELEDEREGFVAADLALRRQLAHDQTQLRDLQKLVAELEELVPKSRRKRRQAEREAEPPPVEFRLPYFAVAFYKSLAGKDRRAVEQAVHAVLLFCTQGYGYPSLEVKQLGGQDTWSLRASLGLRVYFRPRRDGDIDVLEVADREEQDTTLRRLKER